MPDEIRFPETGLWSFALSVYPRPGVADACIALQDRHGLDVNLLLLACWLAGSGRSLDHDAVRRIRKAIEPWQSDVVTPLRSVRRRLKRELHAHGENDPRRVVVSELRKRLMAIELDAEHHEICMIADVVGEGGPDATPAPELALDIILALYKLGTADARELRVLLAACFDDPETVDAALTRLRP